MGKMTDALRKARLRKKQKEGSQGGAPTEVERPVVPPAPPEASRPTGGQGRPPEGEPQTQRREPESIAWESQPAPVAAEAEVTKAPTAKASVIWPEVEPQAQPAVPTAPVRETVLPEVEPTPVEANRTYMSVHYRKDDRTAEEFRRLKNHLSTQGASAQVILVTSCGPDEGKTTLVVNLAVSFANTYGEKVVLVDGNMLRPKIGEVLSLPEEGLGQIIRGHMRAEEATVKTDIPGLWAVSAGESAGRSEGLLDSKAPVELLGRLRRRFTRVVMELPAASDAPEALALASQADVVLIPVMRSRTRRRRLRRLIQRINNHSPDKVRCVFVEA